MAEFRGCEDPHVMRVRSAIVKILTVVDQPTLVEILREIKKLDIDMDYCCEHPDVLCSILKIARGRSYVDLIRSVSD